MLDTGLMITQSFASNVADRKELYGKLLNGKLNVNMGMVFENMVAQELVMTGHELEFAKFKVKDGGETVPVECKSATSSKHTSLDLFMETHKDSVKRAYVIHGKDLRVDGNVTYIPVYMTMFL